MASIGYARVSTKEQELTNQLAALNEAGCERVFHGKQSGVSEENTIKLQELIDYVRNGDVVVVTKLDRLGRSLKSILDSIGQLHEKGAFLTTLDRAIDTSNGSPFAQAQLSLIATFAQLERDLIVDRTTEGREAAKAKGVAFGRRSALSDEQKATARKEHDQGMNISQLAKKYGVGRPTIYRALESDSIK